MKNMTNKLLKNSKLILASSLLALSIQPVMAADDQPVMTNETVKSMHKMGFGDAVIIAKIEQSKTDFNVDMDQLTALKSSGISGDVMAAMISAKDKAQETEQLAVDNSSPDPMVQHHKGLYILNDWGDTPKMVEVAPTLSDQAKTGGLFGYLITGGIASMSYKSVIKNEDARVQSANTKPVFYIFFDKSVHKSNETSAQVWAAGGAVSVSNPGEFTLVELTVKKNRREARVGSFNIAGAKAGVMDKDRIAFDFEEVRPGVYKVSPTNPLEPGEYAFLYPVSMGSATGSAAAGAMSARIFDFGILEGDNAD